MRAYRWVWSVGWLAAAALPVGFGLLVAPPVAVLCLGIIAAGAVRAAGVPIATAVGSGLAVSATIAALCWLGTPALAMPLLAWLSSPAVVGRAVSSRRRAARGGTDEGPGALDALDDRALCLAWCESLARLAAARTDDERVALVDFRQACLDELEARDAEGFQAWLRSEAWPLEDPARYVRRDRPYGGQWSSDS